MPRGIPKNPKKARAKLCASMKKYYKEHPEVKAKKRDRMLGDKNPAKKPEVKKKLRKPKSEEGRANMKGHSGVYPRTEEYRAKQSITTKKKWEDPEYYAKKCAAGKKRWKDPEYRQHMIEAHIGHKESEESGKKRSETLKAQYANGRNSNSKQMVEIWKDSKYRERTLKAIFDGVKRKPTKPEKNLDKYLQQRLPNEWKYVGDGSFWMRIDGKFVNPDFVNINGQKKIIELYGDYWHSEKVTGKTNKEEEQQRINLFAKYGYKTLVIWEHELKDISSVANKIEEFSNG